VIERLLFAAATFFSRRRNRKIARRVLGWAEAWAHRR
jgi:hypothetical protein